MSAYPEETNRALLGIQAVKDKPCAHGAAVLGAHMEAPFLCPKYKGAQLEECLCSGQEDGITYEMLHYKRI